MKIRYLGHSAFQIELNGTLLVIDPFISGNPAAKDIDVAKIKADYVLLTHGHGDHVADAELIAKQNDALIISNFEIVNWFQEKGLKGHALNHGGKYDFGFATIKYVQATHTSSMPDGRYGGNPGGFVVWNYDHCFYHAGDTGLTMDMKLIPMLCPPLELAILPIGDNFTMGYEEALIASDFIQCNFIIPCHFDTMDAIRVDKEKIEKAFAEKSKMISFLKIGEEIEKL